MANKLFDTSWYQGALGGRKENLTHLSITISNIC